MHRPTALGRRHSRAIALFIQLVEAYLANSSILAGRTVTTVHFDLFDWNFHFTLLAGKTWPTLTGKGALSGVGASAIIFARSVVGAVVQI